MDRSKKNRKPKNKRERGYRKRSNAYFPNIDPAAEIRILIQKSLKEDTTYINTPFGDILINDGMVLQLIRNKHFLIEFTSRDGIKKEKDALEHLVYFEKVNDKYPNEPYIKHGIALGYESLKEKEKYQAAVKKNFNQYKWEYPNIDIEYIKLMFYLKEQDIASSLVGAELNLHKIYPKIKAFDEETVIEFYTILIDIFRYRKDLETAKKCAEIVGCLDVKQGNFLETILEFAENPWKKIRYLFLILLAFIAFLAIVIWVGWGIIQFFQWIF